MLSYHSTVHGGTIGNPTNVLVQSLTQRLESEVLFSQKDIYTYKRVTGHVQDGDLQTINLVKEFKQSINIFMDPNHVKFARILNKFNERGKKFFSFF